MNTQYIHPHTKQKQAQIMYGVSRFVLIIDNVAFQQSERPGELSSFQAMATKVCLRTVNSQLFVI